MGKNKLFRLLACMLVFSLATSTITMARTGYREPARNITRIVDTPNPPQISVSPAGHHALLVEYTT